MASTVIASGCTINLGGAGSDTERVESNESLSQDPSASDEKVQAVGGVGTGETYLEIVNEVNCLAEEVLELERANSLGDGSVDPAMLPDAKRLFARLAVARENAIRGLIETTWPEDVANEIDLIARDWSKVARTEVLLSEAPDLGAYNQLVASYGSFTSTGNPGYVRIQLGVGPATETNDC